MGPKILGLVLGRGYRCLQLLRSSREGILNAIDEFHDILLSIEILTKSIKTEKSIKRPQCECRTLHMQTANISANQTCQSPAKLSAKI